MTQIRHVIGEGLAPPGAGSGAAAAFTGLFRSVLARQVEYSVGDAPDRMTTMIPLAGDEVSAQLAVLAAALPFGGEWSWAIPRFIRAVRPDAFLLRLDWEGSVARAVTLYCRFPVEPDDASLQAAMRHARPFRWQAPAPSALAGALGVPGPRGIALRASADGTRQTALYFKSALHVGADWDERLVTLLSACGWNAELAPTIARDLRPLYRPGPLGVVGIDDTARVLKFDPAEVPLADALAFLSRRGVAPERLAALRSLAQGLRADSASYVGVQYDASGFAGWRLYFACEPARARRPGLASSQTQRQLRPTRRGPHD